MVINASLSEVFCNLQGSFIVQSVRKEKHACSSNKKGHVLVHLRQFEDENPKQPINLKLFESENAGKIKKDID